MEFLWSPWRYQYIQANPQQKGCVFCQLAKDRGPEADEANYIVHRGQHNFVVLNLYPYTSGHVLIVPYAHIALISEADKSITDEMMDLAKQMQRVIGIEYRPSGYNLGMNLGRAAGAGVAGHFHLHLVPRWVGDTNFMTTLGEVRVLPEALADTYRRLRKHF